MQLHACPKCGGTLSPGSDQWGAYLSCLQCGLLEEVDVAAPEALAPYARDVRPGGDGEKRRKHG